MGSGLQNRALSWHSQMVHLLFSPFIMLHLLSSLSKMNIFSAQIYSFEKYG